MDRSSARSLVCFCVFLLIMGKPGSAGSAEPAVGVYYFPGWYRAAGDPEGEYSEWREAIMKAAVPRALCGFYNDADPRLWAYYIPWMTTHGIDFIAFDWYYNAGQEYLYESLDRGFLQARKTNDVKFCIHWCNHGGSWWRGPLDQSKPAVLAMTDLLCARYFHRPNYLRIDGRPVFMIYDINILLGFGGQEAVRETLAAMRQRVQQKGFPGLYLVAVYSAASPEYIAMLKTLGFDAFAAYTYSWMRPPTVVWNTPAVPYPDLVDMLADYLYPYLERIGRMSGIPYWPTTFSGWDDRPRAGLERAFMNVDSSPDEFARMFRAALKHVNPASPVVMVEAWNEWGEGASIEPSKEHGFGFLCAIADALGRRSPNQDVPIDREIASWSVLTPEELKIAKENESRPWPGKRPRMHEFGESFDAPRVPMPYVFDFTSGGIPPGELRLDGISIKEQTADGTLFETTGHDPKIFLPTVQIPMEQIRRITVEGQVVGSVPEDPAQREIEIFWSTARMPEFTQFASAPLSWASTGCPSVDTADIPWWKATGTPLLGLRFDPCGGSGLTFRLRRLVLSGD